MKIQVTLYDKSGKYRPVSTLVKVASKDYFNNNREKVKVDGIKKKKLRSGWTRRELSE